MAGLNEIPFASLSLIPAQDTSRRLFGGLAPEIRAKVCNAISSFFLSSEDKIADAAKFGKDSFVVIYFRRKWSSVGKRKSSSVAFSKVRLRLNKTANQNLICLL